MRRKVYATSLPLICAIKNLNFINNTIWVEFLVLQELTADFWYQQEMNEMQPETCFTYGKKKKNCRLEKICQNKKVINAHAVWNVVSMVWTVYEVLGRIILFWKRIFSRNIMWSYGVPVSNPVARKSFTVVYCFGF